MMKIKIQTPLKNNEIKNLLDGAELEGIKFTFIEKKGIIMEFEAKSILPSEDIDSDTACAAVKKAIKEEDWGKVLYFSVTVA